MKELQKLLKELQKLLKTEVIQVRFTKLNGEERIMACTLNPALIPSENMPKNIGHEYSDEVLRVFDLDKMAWRSFRFDSIISASVLTGETMNMRGN